MEWNIDVKERLYINLADEILFRIIHEQFPLGSKLPATSQLIKASHTSQETMRKALCLLIERKVILRTRRGYYITKSQEILNQAKSDYIERVSDRYKIALEKVNINKANSKGTQTCRQ